MSFNRDHCRSKSHSRGSDNRVKKEQPTESESIPSSMVVAPPTLSSKIETMVAETINKAPQDNFKSERKHKKYRYSSSKSNKHDTHRNMLFSSLYLV